MISDDEIKAIIEEAGKLGATGSTPTPVKEIIVFLLTTGARLGEVLHSEWSDFDLEKGIWHIRYKPKCPTINGLGWKPKWGKERIVPLLPEAVEILRSLPRHESTGDTNVRDAEFKLIGKKSYPAQFVFPKKEVRHLATGEKEVSYSRVDYLKNPWTTIRNNAGLKDIQIKDFRTYFNHVLRSRLGFSAKEAGNYLGNSALVNDLHYTPISQNEIQRKLSRVSFDGIL